MAVKAGQPAAAERKQLDVGGDADNYADDFKDGGGGGGAGRPVAGAAAHAPSVSAASPTRAASAVYRSAQQEQKRAAAAAGAGAGGDHPVYEWQRTQAQRAAAAQSVAEVDWAAMMAQEREGGHPREFRLPVCLSAAAPSVPDLLC
jgi:hypothetical protein